MLHQKTIQNELSVPLLARLDYIRLQPQKILVCSQYPDFAVSQLQLRYKKAIVKTVSNMLQTSDDADTVDFIFSELPLLNHDINIVFHLFYRALKNQGLLLFSSLGPDSLPELSMRPNNLVDMHNIGDALLAAQFSDPVTDSDRMTLAYSDAIEVLQDVRSFFSNDAMQYCAEKVDDYYPLTIELVSGHGWKIVEPEKAETKEHCISVDSFRKK
ncbi:MAG: hypothetical protein A3I77_05985 [Gammaproteobacteria bacterium RIFCSPLOWO2_02_FULL_42_14]|nr:MAG: hypothetical protein A3B71_06575 [Gammaproteobacteria bacterium RIFCSPHIGHO2_02_FULL_42_43]OGT28107.1 MAG: hypothetical protein A2624_03495 [Gammaproteobacteria bacterium RIFCSPHIGHO2_01_FULL_42_8]OGT52546.1 MAG: hypothetical protein A3E54_06180 [Gammaproteobacteria bacterium RIFCSPHIGHO2_12_FULL_41_25]OGT63144.1 MAG: hypothetical protein A3I77_05985 [Gammaproteobacteria bacterium RIFCSPLOWO2_02_FULL_42_14]OGT86644.1 MAG: hypothetical protein A3G86_04805 [Gammaproteobacteria bacterium R